MSIGEDTSVGTQIVKVGDLSTSIRDQSTVYSIVGGNENTQFTIENITSKCNIISFIVLLTHYEHQPLYIYIFKFGF